MFHLGGKAGCGVLSWDGCIKIKSEITKKSAFYTESFLDPGRFSLIKIYRDIYPSVTIANGWQSGLDRAFFVSGDGLCSCPLSLVYV